jgi:hypothetical protein
MLASAKLSSGSERLRRDQEFVEADVRAWLSMCWVLPLSVDRYQRGQESHAVLRDPVNIRCLPESSLIWSKMTSTTVSASAAAIPSSSTAFCAFSNLLISLMSLTVEAGTLLDQI